MTILNLFKVPRCWRSYWHSLVLCLPTNRGSQTICPAPASCLLSLCCPFFCLFCFVLRSHNNKGQVRKKRMKKCTSSSAVSSNTIIRLLFLIALTIYWLLLLKFGPQGLINTTDDKEVGAGGANDGNNGIIAVTSSNINNNTDLRLQQQQQKQPLPLEKSSSISLEGYSTNEEEGDSSAESSLRQDQQPGPHRRRPKISLLDLINTDRNPTCNPGKANKSLIEHTIVPDDIVYHPLGQRKIPKIIHMTSKTRCMTPDFHTNINKWRIKGFSVVFHDDAAVNRLLNHQSWPEFPHLQLAQHCLLKGASTADLWRYLVLWEYGGFYADIDSAPGKLFESTINNHPDYESFFVVESIGIMSQYFMSGMAYHPYFHLCVTICLERLFVLVNHVGKQNIPITTGPGVVKVAMVKFMANEDSTKKYGRITAGTYTGLANRSITVVGSRGGSKNWIKRESMKHEKIQGYAAMGMKHFSHIKVPGMNISCHEHLYNQYLNRTNSQ